MSAALRDYHFDDRRAAATTGTILLIKRTQTFNEFAALAVDTRVHDINARPADSDGARQHTLNRAIQTRAFLARE